jgi:signal peptidase II
VEENTVKSNKKIFISLSVILVCFLLDRLSKIYIIEYFMTNDVDNLYINNILNLSLIWNKGIAFGFFQSENFLYEFISLLIFLIILVIIYLIWKSQLILEVLFYSMVVGGATGNFFDRIYYKAVPDFIDFHYGNFHWFTFNISDICISIGIVFLLIFDIFKINKSDTDLV